MLKKGDLAIVADSNGAVVQVGDIVKIIKADEGNRCFASPAQPEERHFARPSPWGEHEGLPLWMFNQVHLAPYNGKKLAKQTQTTRCYGAIM